MAQEKDKEKKAWIVFFKSIDPSTDSTVVFLQEAAAVRAAGKEAAHLAKRELDELSFEDPDDTDILKAVLEAAGKNDWAGAFTTWEEYASDISPDDDVEIMEVPLVTGPKDWSPS